MINKKLFLFLSLLSALLITTSCEEDEEFVGNWVNCYEFSGYNRAGAVCFVIDGTPYLGLGYNDNRNTEEQYFKDMYYYTGETTWYECAPFPGHGRQGAFSFAVDGKAYIGCGLYNDTAEIYFNDVWEFNPAADSADQWTQLADFPSTERTDMVSFVAAGKGFVAGGAGDNDATFKDCYVFDTSTKEFTQMTDLGYKRSGAFAFVIDDMVYIGGGYSSGSSYVTEFELYDAVNDVWNNGNSYTILRDIYLSADITDDIDHYDDVLNLCRTKCVTFVKDGRGYIASGLYSSSARNDCWVYNPETDLWTEKTDFESGMNSRSAACSFTLDDVPYILTGYTGSTFLYDMWTFEPYEDEDDDDN